MNDVELFLNPKVKKVKTKLLLQVEVSLICPTCMHTMTFCTFCSDTKYAIECMKGDFYIQHILDCEG